MAVHRVDALEGDQLGRFDGPLGELGFEIGDVVMAENALFTAAAPDALDHRGVVLLVREDDHAGKKLLDGGERGIVGDVGGGE